MSHFSNSCFLCCSHRASRWSALFTAACEGRGHLFGGGTIKAKSIFILKMRFVELCCDDVLKWERQKREVFKDTQAKFKDFI